MSLLQDAYVIFADGKNRSGSSIQMPPIEKAPAWLTTDLYTIDAAAEGKPGQLVMLGPMMKSLLEKRFHLNLHNESRSEWYRSALPARMFRCSCGSLSDEPTTVPSLQATGLANADANSATHAPAIVTDRQPLTPELHKTCESAGFRRGLITAAWGGGKIRVIPRLIANSVTAVNSVIAETGRILQAACRFAS